MILNRENVSHGALVVGKQMPAQTGAPIQSVNAPTPGLDWDALPASTDGYVLVCQASAAEGVAWVSPSSASLPSGSANEVIATPNGLSGASSLRTLVAADLPAVPITGLGSLAASSLLGNPTGSSAVPEAITLGTGLSFSGTTLVSSGGGGTPGGTSGQIQYDNAGSFGGFTMSGDATLVASTGVITIAAGAVTLAKHANLAASSLIGNPTGSPATPQAITLGTGLSFSSSTLTCTATGSGTVTSVSWTGDGTIFTASADTAVTTSGTLTPVGLIAQAKNTVLAGPSTGSNAAPAFRALAAADLPATGLTITQHVSAYNADTIVSGTWTAACGSYDNHSATLAAATTLALSGATIGQWIRVRAQQAASGGPYTLTQPSGVTWFTPSFSAPTMPATASGVLIVAFYCTGSGTYDGFLAGTSST